MDPNASDQNVPPDVSAAPHICPYCHQPVLLQYYFCPNCGTKLSSAPLSTTPLAQAGIYAFSIILPMICFLAVTKWPGPKYYRSGDPKAKLIGAIAWVLLILSTAVTFWFAYTWAQDTLQSLGSSLNSAIGN